MNIDEMTPEEKSVKLARLCGWDVWRLAVNGNTNDIIVEDANGVQLGEYFLVDKMHPDLYALENMSLAQKVMQWANKSGLLPEQSFVDQLAYTFTYAKDGQQQALDMVLAFAIEAGW